MIGTTTELFWPALLISLLAVIIAAVIVGRNSDQLKHIHQTSTKGQTSGTSSSLSHQKCPTTTKKQDSCSDDGEDVFQTDSLVDSLTERGKDSSESGIENALRDYADSPDAENKPLKYMAGKLRTSQLEKMMTKEELEEEQRVQREQLAAIFQLLRDKQDTFGEVTNQDLEEQLKLYSI